jgi:drug/metabolite transporter (DMT)-like permease
MNKSTRAHAAILLANLIYGANFSIAKVAMPEYIRPSGFILLRVIVALIMFWIFSKMTDKNEKIAAKDHVLLFMLGMFGVAINQLLFFEGLSRTSNINAALIMTSTPIMVMAAASVLHKERISWARGLGIVLGVGGASSLILARKDVSGNATWQGDLMILINAASYAIFIVGSKPLMKKYSPWLVIRWTFFYGLLLVLPFGYQQVSLIEWETFTLPVWLATAYVIIATTFFAYLFNTYGLHHLSASVVSFYIYLQPVFATLISLLITHERVTVVQLIACLLIFSGVYLVNKRSGGVDDNVPLPKE